METDIASSYWTLFKTEYRSDGCNQQILDKGDREDDRIWEEDFWTESELQKAFDRLSNKKNGDDNVTSVRDAKVHVVQRFEREAALNWDKFYTRNSTNFFKDRHYLEEVFPELLMLADKRKKCLVPSSPYLLLEIGCGVGNALLPLLERNRGNANFHAWGFDLSSVAIELMKKDKRFVKAELDGQARAAIWDVTANPCPLLLNMKEHPYVGADAALLLFCLSAVSPQKMEIAAKHIIETLKQGGTLLFRDYGRYDEAEMKLDTAKGKRLGEHFYAKQDGTRCYYFDLDDVKKLFCCDTNGESTSKKMEIVELKYIRRIYKNRGDNSVRRRVWVHGRFRKL